jgi:hypothetical protein
VSDVLAAYGAKPEYFACTFWFAAPEMVTPLRVADEVVLRESKNTLRLFEPLFGTAKSGLPSPLKSPVAINDGLLPAGIAVGCRFSGTNPISREPEVIARLHAVRGIGYAASGHPLEKDTPEPRPIQSRSSGQIIAIPEVGGLHHRYKRRAA